jgi:hypothetical protein
VLGSAAALTVGLAVAVAVAGCTSAPAGTASSGARERVPVTVAQARQAWEHYVAVSGAQTIKTGNFSLALPLETGPQRAYDSAAILALKQEAKARHQSESGQPAPLIDLQSEQLLSFAAMDPTAAGGKVQVIAMGGGLTSATAS